MDTKFRIERTGTKYRVIEELPNRGAFQMVGFPSEQSARIWLESYRREIRRPVEASPAEG